jgi:hypothetical protein
MTSSYHKPKNHQGNIEFSIVKVRLDKILGQDPFTADFLASQGYVTDMGFNMADWDSAVAFLACHVTLVPLLKRKAGYHYLGTGRTLSLLQQVLEPHHEIHTLVLHSSRVAAEVKLDILAMELLLIPAFFRARQLLPQKTMRLWEAMMDAGAQPIRGLGGLAFARATGFSYNSIKPPKGKIRAPITGQADDLQISEDTITGVRE